MPRIILLRRLCSYLAIFQLLSKFGIRGRHIETNKLKMRTVGNTGTAGEAEMKKLIGKDIIQ